MISFTSAKALSKEMKEWRIIRQAEDVVIHIESGILAAIESGMTTCSMQFVNEFADEKEVMTRVRETFEAAGYKFSTKNESIMAKRYITCSVTWSN